MKKVKVIRRRITLASATDMLSNSDVNCKVDCAELPWLFDLCCAAVDAQKTIWYDDLSKEIIKLVEP